MPAGSPIVTRIGRSAPGLSAGFDIGVAAKIAKIAPREIRDLRVEKLLFDLLARRDGVGGDDRRALVAAYHHLDAGRREEGRGRLAGPGLVDGFLNLRAEIGDFNTEFGEVLNHQTMDLLRNLGQRLAAIDMVVNLNRNLQRIDRKSTRLNSSHVEISYAVFCLKKKRQYLY